MTADPGLLLVEVSVLPGYGAQVGEDASLHSRRKLEFSSEELVPFLEKNRIGTIDSFPCKNEAHTLGYRCKCSFQVIHDGNQYQYAMRHKGEPVALGSSSFPIANNRIRLAMHGFWKDVMNATETGFPNISNKSLTSLTFAASWSSYIHDPNITSGSSSDCIVTLNYDTPLEDKEEWLKEAREVSRILNAQLRGRSRGRLYSAKPTGTGSLTSFLRDTVFLHPPTKHRSSWSVSLPTTTEPHDKQDIQTIPVQYHKPETAFFHPNAKVMCQALTWMLDRISVIVAASTAPCRLLEMYCGCGAHTLALARSGLLIAIQAVELDQRLVDACKVNIDLNVVSNSDSTARQSTHSSSMTPVRVAQGDAGKWARKLRQRLTRHEASGSADPDENFNILLVDPPRQGLDAQVIDMAISATFEHVLIISCGHQALVRDLQVLCDHFEIVNCTQLDLFPRTDSVETLVHLRRRRQASS